MSDTMFSYLVTPSVVYRWMNESAQPDQSS